MKYKTFIAGAAILASAVLGDCCNVKDRFIEPVRYRNVSVDCEGYQKPFQLQKKYDMNEKGELEVYIGNDNQWYKVYKDMRVNERRLNEILKEDVKEVKSKIINKINDIINWCEKSFKDGNHN